MKYDGLFAIEDTQKDRIIQSEYSMTLAQKGVKTLNDHEERHGRPMVYRVVEITEEELKTLRLARD